MIAALALAFPALATAAPKPIGGFVGGTAGINTGGLFTQPRDIAVYTGGDADVANDKIFVAEGLSNNSRVQRLDRDGNFELIWGRDAVRTGAPGDTGAGFEICSAAVSGAANCKPTPSGSGQGELDDPRGIAVDQATGSVYVLDRDNERIQQFTIDGTFVRAWGTEGTGAGQLGATGVTTGIAVSPVAPHDVFATDPANRRVLQFEADGTFVRAWGHGVANGADAFQVCTAACQAGNTTGSAARFADGWPRDVTVDADGVVYVSDGADDQRIVRFDSDLSATPAAALLAPLPSPGLLLAGDTFGLELDPATGSLLVGRNPASGSSVVQEVADPGGPLGGPSAPTVVDSHPYSDQSTPQGLGYSPSDGNVYIGVPDALSPPTGTFLFDGECQVLTGNRTCAGLFVLAAGAPPTVDALTVLDAGSTTAQLEASMDANGGVGQYRFEVSLDGVEWEPVGGGYIAGYGTRTVSADVTGLEPATLYQLRLTLSKQSGFSTFDLASAGDTVVTDPAAPDVQTAGSTNRTTTGARLRGRVDPNGSATAYRFELGLADGPLDRHVPVPDASAGSGNRPVLLTQDVDGLLPGTAYRYRVVASNVVGDAVGDIVTFETPSEGAPPAGPARGLELVSPADKLSGAGAGFWYSGPGAIGFVGEGAHAGERFAVRGQLGSVLTDGAFAWANDWALAERTPQGWVSSPVATRRGHGTQYKAFLDMSAAARDLSLMSWTSNGHSITVFEEMEGWDDDQLGDVLLLRDWAGAWEPFVSPTDPRENRASPNGPIAIAADGSAVLAGARGLGGEGDPSADSTGGSVFLNDVSAGLSDSFPGDGIKRAINVCTDGTVFPAVVSVGGDPKLAQQPCLPPAPGDYARIIGNQQSASFELRPGVMSADASRVFFASGDTVTSCSGTGLTTSCPAQLYVRQRNADGEVVVRWLSRTEVTAANGASEDQDASLTAPVVFEGASADGDKALFRTRSPLTADDRNGQSTPPPPGGIVSGLPESISWDLYMYDLGEGDDPTVGGSLTRVTAGPNGDGDCNSGDTQAGAARFVSDDGMRVYFACAAPLPGVGVAGSGTIAEPGGTPTSTDFSNLYLYDANLSGDERWRFVARIPRDSELGECATTSTSEGPQIAPLSAGRSEVQLSDGNNCVRGTPDGSLITLWTDGQLTADDPDDSSGDIYGYDAVRDELTRVSAPQGGPGGSYQCAPGGTSSAQCHGDGGIGAPGAAPLARLGVGSGVDGVPLLFFESRSRLVAADTDDAYDVYQWRAGELSLVSVGADGADGAFFAGNDRSGRNVYVATRDRLTWQDSDAVLDVYTARVGGGIAEPPEPPVCAVLGDSCQGPGAGPTSPPRIDSGDSPGAGDAPRGPRVRVTLAGVSRAAARKAARTGVLVARVRVSRAATLRVVARARVGGRTRKVARGRVRAARAGVVRVRLRLSGPARRQLRAGRQLGVMLSAGVSGGRPDTSSVILRRGRR